MYVCVGTVGTKGQCLPGDVSKSGSCKVVWHERERERGRERRKREREREGKKTVSLCVHCCVGINAWSLTMTLSVS